MLVRRGYKQHLSFGAFDKDLLVSFTLNCTGLFNGVETAYDTGTGTIEAYRRKGISTRIFDYALPFFHQLNLKQYLLEVITTNETAISVYKKAGFNIVRELNFFTAAVKDLSLNEQLLPTDFDITNGTLPNEELFTSSCEYLPAWQNSHSSLKRAETGLKTLHLTYKNTLAGIGVIEPYTGDIPFLFIEKNYRKQGLGSALLKALILHAKTESVKVINLDSGFTTGEKFLVKNGILKRGAQFEMIKPL